MAESRMIAWGYSSNENINIISEYIGLVAKSQLPGSRTQVKFKCIDHDSDAPIFLNTPRGFHLTINGANDREIAGLTAKLENIMGAGLVHMKSPSELIIKRNLDEMAGLADKIEYKDPHNYTKAENAFYERVSNVRSR